MTGSISPKHLISGVLVFVYRILQRYRNEPMRLRRREAVEMDSTKPHRKTPSIHEAGMYRPTVGLMLNFLEGRAAIGKISEEFVIYMSRPSLNNKLIYMPSLDLPEGGDPTLHRF